MKSHPFVLSLAIGESLFERLDLRRIFVRNLLELHLQIFVCRFQSRTRMRVINARIIQIGKIDEQIMSAMTAINPTAAITYSCRGLTVT